MPDTPSITIVKKFTYRGQPEEFSNTYHFSGTVPTTEASWKTLADAIIAAEKLTVTSLVTFVRAYGYEAGNEHSVAQIDYAVPPNTVVAGSYTAPASGAAPGDTVATVRWYTGELNSRGKKIYCRKYFHNVYVGAPTPDTLITAQSTLFATFGAKMIDGTLPGSVKYCGPQGAVLQAPEVSPWVTTRTLKRRGKRPLASG